MSGQPTVLQVVILRDGLLVGTEVLIPGKYVIGSSPQADVRLDDPSVAAKHAVLYFQNGRVAIQDGGSPVGVYVNGARVTACQVRSVDEVLCGPFVLKARPIAQKEEGDEVPPEVAAILGNSPPAVTDPSVAALLGNGAPPITDSNVTVRAPAPAAMASTIPSARQQRLSGEMPAIAAPQPQAAPQPRAAQPARAQAPAPTSQPLPAAPIPLAVAPQQPSAERRGVAPAQARSAPAQRPAPVVAPPPPPDFDENAALNVKPAVEASMPLGEQLFGDSMEDLPEITAEPTSPRLRLATEPAPAPAPTRPIRAARAVSQPSIPSARAEQPAPAQRPEPARRAPPPPPPEAAATEPVPAAASPRKAGARPSTVRVSAAGKGKPRLYLEWYWGDVRCQARSFSAATGKKAEPIEAAAREDAPLPVYGFNISESGFLMAVPQGDSFRVFVPPRSAVERCKLGESFTPVDPNALDASGNRRSVVLSKGMAARFTDGDHSLVAYVAPPPERVWVNPLSDLPLLALTFFLLLAGGMGAFLHYIPKNDDTPDFTAKGLAPVAVRLIAPEPKKKEEAKKKLEAIKETAKKEKPVEKVAKQEKVIEKAVPKAAQAAPETKALKALAKLSAAGPAMNDLLAAVDKLGNGPGSKNAKSNYKLSGLIGKAPLANAGLGTFGLGGGGKGGIATLGAELLRGKGGGGIGAMGAGNVGKGAVGGTVSHATARAVSAPQGSIDREAVAKVINSHLQEVRACYERALLKDPSLSGKVVLEWGIGPSGHVSSVKTKSSSLRNGSVESCILNELKGWVFPAPRGGSVLITYPFLFNSVGY